MATGKYPQHQKGSRSRLRFSVFLGSILLIATIPVWLFLIVFEDDDGQNTGDIGVVVNNARIDPPVRQDPQYAAIVEGKAKASEKATHVTEGIEKVPHLKGGTGGSVGGTTKEEDSGRRNVSSGRQSTELSSSMKLEKALADFYREVNPAKLANLDKILAMYQKDYMELIQQLQTLYGPELVLKYKLEQLAKASDKNITGANDNQGKGANPPPPPPPPRAGGGGAAAAAGTGGGGGRRAALTAFYRGIGQPSKLDNLDQILALFEGDWGGLVAELEGKYGPALVKKFKLWDVAVHRQDQHTQNERNHKSPPESNNGKHSLRNNKATADGNDNAKDLDIRTQLRAFYQLHNHERLNDIETILKAYRKDEYDVLMEDLKAAYGEKRFAEFWALNAEEMILIAENGKDAKGVKQTNVKKECKGYYKVGDRKDFRDSIGQALEDLGLCPTHHKHGWDVFWGLQWDGNKVYQNYMSEHIKDGALVAGIPLMKDELGTKPALARLHRRCQQVFAKMGKLHLCDFTKIGFNFKVEDDTVDSPYEEIKEYAMNFPAPYPQVWIIKPQDSFGGRGIRLGVLKEHDLSSAGRFAAWLRAAAATEKDLEGRAFAKWTMQAYNFRPLLYKGHKFDIRTWAVVTSINPLRIWMLEKMFPKVASVPYTTSPLNFTSPCVHWKIPSGPMCPVDQIVRPYPKSTLVPHWAPHLAPLGEEAEEAAGGRRRPRRPHDGNSSAAASVDWGRDIVPRIAGVIVKSVLLSLGKPLVVDNYIKNHNKHYNRFLHLSPDFTVDENGKVLMIEMNTNGFMIGDRYSRFVEAQLETLQELQLLGVGGDGDTSDGGAEAAVVAAELEEFCLKLGHDACGAEGRRQLKALAHEEAAAQGTQWRRVFPPATPAAAAVERRAGYHHGGGGGGGLHQPRANHQTGGGVAERPSHHGRHRPHHRQGHGGGGARKLEVLSEKDQTTEQKMPTIGQEHGYRTPEDLYAAFCPRAPSELDRLTWRWLRERRRRRRRGRGAAAAAGGGGGEEGGRQAAVRWEEEEDGVERATDDGGAITITVV